MKRLAITLIIAASPVAAQGQQIPHEPIAHICLTDGQCVELPGGVVFPSQDACQLALPQLYVALVQHLMRRGLAPHIMTSEVDCDPMGIDG